jgi:hypothetical protein
MNDERGRSQALYFRFLRGVAVEEAKEECHTESHKKTWQINASSILFEAMALDSTRTGVQEGVHLALHTQQVFSVLILVQTSP